MRYMVVIEEGPTSYGAYVPDLPGCIAAGESVEKVLQLIQASNFILKDLKKKAKKSRYRITQARLLKFKFDDKNRTENSMW